MKEMLTKIMEEQNSIRKNIGDMEKKVMSSLDLMNSKFKEMKLENFKMKRKIFF